MQTEMNPETQITVSDLHARMDRGEDLFIVDVRNRDEFAAWKIDGATTPPMVNVPYFEIIEEGGEADMVDSVEAYARRYWTDHLPSGKIIVAVCAQGGTSDLVAAGLRRLGYYAVNLAGGTQAWGAHYEIREVVASAGLSIYQLIRPARGCLSYVVASAGEVVVIDPLRHTDRYADFVRSRGLQPVRVLDTHGHADHISSGPELAQRWQVPYHLHAYDAIHPLDVLPATIQYEPIRDGQEFTVGEATLQAMHIPGHTLGNMAYVLDGRYVFSGDSIFIDSIARPDLGGKGDTWAPLHYGSLRRLLDMPEDTVVLPGHFSSFREANEQGVFARSLGDLKTGNTGIKAVEQGATRFVEYILSSLPDFPDQYVEIKRVNIGLSTPDEDEAEELELGRNICALSQAYATAEQNGKG